MKVKNVENHVISVFFSIYLFSIYQWVENLLRKIRTTTAEVIKNLECVCVFLKNSWKFSLLCYRFMSKTVE